MRWNRGTIILITALLVVIIAVLVINNNQASAPGETPTPAENTGPLLPITDAGTITSYQVRDNSTGEFVTLSKDDGGAWNIDATHAMSNRDPEQSLIDSTAGQLVSVQYANSFSDDQLATFGLDHPAYTIFVTTDTATYAVYVGNKSPTSPRYYAVLDDQYAPPESTVEPGAAIADENAAASADNTLGGEVLSNVTAEPSATVNANATPDFPEATDESAELSVQPGAAIATENIDGNSENTIGGEVLADVTAEPNAISEESLMEATPEATMEMTVEATAEATPNLIIDPEVALSGPQTVYLIPQTVIDTLTKWLQTPPYAPEPTAAPDMIPTEASTDEAVGVDGTTVGPTPLLEEGGANDLIPAGTPIATQEATDEATAEATTAP